MRDNTILIFIIGILILYSLYDLKVDKGNEAKLNDLRNNYKVLDSLYQWKSKRLKIYVLIDLEQSKVIDKYQSSRNESLRNQILRNLQDSIN